MSDGLKLRVILKSPPLGVDFGLQSGHGNDYEVVSKQRSGKGNLQFELSVGIKDAKSTELDFKGPFVQGKKGERFFYIDIGKCAGQAESAWSRRLKIPLLGISRRAAASGRVLETAITGTGKDGGPACATPKDFAGWKPR